MRSASATESSLRHETDRLTAALAARDVNGVADAAMVAVLHALRLPRDTAHVLADRIELILLNRMTKETQVMAQPKKLMLTDEQKRAALEAALAAQKPRPAPEEPTATGEDEPYTVRIRLTDEPGAVWRPTPEKPPRERSA